MTNRPTDDFDDMAEDQAALNNPDEDDAAFGSAPREGDRDHGRDVKKDERQKSNYDDSDFVEDDMADIADELADEVEEAVTEDYAAGDLTDEQDYDVTDSDEAVEYDIVEEDEAAEDNQQKKRGSADDGKRYFGKYKKNDLIFYGIFALLGVFGLVLIISTLTGDGAEPQSQPLTLDSGNAAPVNNQAAQQPAPQPANISGMVVPDNSNIPTARDLPVPTPEPMPDGIGVAGGISTLGEEAPTPRPAPETTPPTMPAPTAEMPSVTAQQDVASSPPVLSQPQPQAETPAPTMAPLADEPLAPVAQVTAPPSLGVDNTSLAERMSEMGVKLAELNARLSQINDTLTGLQTSTTKLDQQSQELSTKTTELSTRVDQQNSALNAKFDEAARQRDELQKQIADVKNAKPAAAAATTTNTAALDDLKISVAQLERRVANINKSQGATERTAAAPRQPQSFDGPPPPAATPVRPVRKEARDVVEIPAPRPGLTEAQIAQNRLEQETGMREQPRSPKARAEAGLSSSTQSANSWVLRAATPNMAWLSPRPGSAELRRVAIGDAVEGLGQIQAIRQEAGRWVVVGTQGTVR